MNEPARCQACSEPCDLNALCKCCLEQFDRNEHSDGAQAIALLERWVANLDARNGPPNLITFRELNREQDRIEDEMCAFVHARREKGQQA